jgi:WD40 repeat protein
MFTDCSCFAPDGRVLATGGDLAHHAVKLWDFATRSEMLTLRAPGGMIQNLAFSPDGNTLLALSADPEFHVYLWRVPSFAEIDAAEGR